MSERGERTPGPHGQGRAAQAASFGRAAGAYARGRPPYPAQAVDWLVPPGARRVLDLGAGTGKLTAALSARSLDVTAVEPSAAMLAELSAALPGVRALAGSAEAVPLPVASVDAVLVAQAWHWVDPARALPEVARVLVPGGRLGLVWNVRDERAGWVAALSALLLAAGEDAAASAGGLRHVGARTPDLGDRFGPVETAVWDWTHTTDRAGVVDMIASRSYVITAPPAQRERLLRSVERLLDTHPGTAGRDLVRVPYRTHAHRAARLPA